MRFDLQREAATFANELSELLNNTLCDGIRVTAITTQKLGRALVGPGITRQSQKVRAVPARLGRKRPAVYLGLSFRLAVDRESAYLMATSSFMGVFEDSALEHLLMHYDYERDKADNYPEPHLQVVASSEG